jgi:hypothetical protein
LCVIPVTYCIIMVTHTDQGWSRLRLSNR